MKSVRYADDIVVLTSSADQAQKALQEISRWMGEAGLELHPEKTCIVDMSKAGAHFDFLGYRFHRSQRGNLCRLVRPKSEKKLRDQIRLRTKRSHTKNMGMTVTEVNEVLRGWYGYFKQANLAAHRRMDQWVRMRLRSMLRKRNKRRGRGRGLDHYRWPNRYFEKLGLLSLEQAKVTEMSLQKQAKC